MIDIKVFNEFVKLLNRNVQLMEQLYKSLDNATEKELKDDILTAEQALVYLKISKTTLLEEERAGRIVPARIGQKGIKRYVRAELLSYVQAQKNKTGIHRNS